MKWISLFLACALGGCATQKVVPPSHAAREQMHHVIVRVSSASLAQQFSTPEEEPVAGGGEGAAYGAKAGAGYAVIGGTRVGAGVGCNPGWNVFILISCPVGIIAGAAAGIAAAIPSAAVGAAIGSDKAQTKDRVAEASARFSQILEETDVAKELRRHVVAVLERETDTIIIDLSAEVTPDLGEEPPTQPGMTIGVIVEMATVSMKGRLQPDLYIEIAVKAGLLEPNHVGWIYERSWGYYGEIGEYFQVMAEDGADLRQQIDASLGKVANAIVIDLFLSNEPAPLAPPGRNIKGQVVTTGGPLVQ